MNFPRTKTLTVRATDPSKPVPMAGRWRQLAKETGEDLNVIGEKPVEVPNNRFYRRRVVTGELALAGASALAPAPRVKRKKGEE